MFEFPSAENPALQALKSTCEDTQVSLQIILIQPLLAATSHVPLTKVKVISKYRNMFSNYMYMLYKYKI